ncbi:hypothetical protein [Sphingobacterium siyangense]|uniref:hypothetical protein n=1 Tax=Sphingobacterium siyangense TaxID=459529 RepID=UPI00196574B5|nr:hypothetical protein [Sphingobacterium siyangense]QRY55545.1 hypothetical protein JVX97_16010 [Sphingobacterium siyangense]
MENNKITEIATEKLKERFRMLKVLTYTLAGVLLVSVIFNLFVFKKAPSLMIVPLALLPIVIINMNNISQIRKELAKRLNEQD